MTGSGPATRALRVGTRGSPLALRQAAIVIEALRRIDPSTACTVQIIRTQGDENTTTELAQFSSQGVFVRRIEAALLANEIDIAVHSFKDMPSISPEWLTIAAFLRREDARDVLVSRSGQGLAGLPPGACIGTGSPRRQALIRAARPDVHARPLRGNVDTRLRRVAEGAVDAVVLAAAGLARLGRKGEVAEALDPDVFVPAVGQGIIAVQARHSDVAVLRLAGQLDDPDTRACAVAERSVAMAIGAGCQTPFGAHARVNSDRIHLAAFLAHADGRIVRDTEAGDTARAGEIGEAVGDRLAAAIREIA